MIANISARRDGDFTSVARNAGVLLDALPKAGVKRLAWVGGAGTLEVAPGERFPPCRNYVSGAASGTSANKRIGHLVSVDVGFSGR